MPRNGETGLRCDFIEISKPCPGILRLTTWNGLSAVHYCCLSLIQKFLNLPVKGRATAKVGNQFVILDYFLKVRNRRFAFIRATNLIVQNQGHGLKASAVVEFHHAAA